MTIDKIKKFIEKNKNISKKFVFKGTRNQIDKFEGIITEIYPAIFIIETEKGEKKSFSYNDVLIENLTISD